MRTSLFNYNLPPSLIAQRPSTPRDHSRLFVYHRKNYKINHDFFYNLIKYLQPNDCLVFNQSKVLPARIMMQKETGGQVEVFLLNNLGRGKWEVLLKNIGKNLPCKIFSPKSNPPLRCQIIKKTNNNTHIAQFNLGGKNFLNFLEKHAATPLPPYIKTADSKKIRQQYQTVYAKISGSVAAPTAGLHFTKKLLSALQKSHVKIEFITLHVGLGTFRPVKTKNIEEHQMHAEYAIIKPSVAQSLNKIKKSGGRIIAVGTTSARTLESASDTRGHLRALETFINPFFYPGYKFNFIDGLITNFHLPQSTLMMLVAAFLAQKKEKKIGIKKIQQLYKLAIEKKYSFYSFGDAMLIV